MHSKTPTFEVPQIAMVTKNTPPSTEFLESAYKVGLPKNALLNVSPNRCQGKMIVAGLTGREPWEVAEMKALLKNLTCVAKFSVWSCYYNQKTRIPKTHFWKHCFRSMCDKEITLGNFCNKWSKDINIYEPFNLVYFKNKKSESFHFEYPFLERIL